MQEGLNLVSFSHLVAAGTPPTLITTDKEERTESPITVAVLQESREYPIPRNGTAPPALRAWKEGTLDPPAGLRLPGRKTLVFLGTEPHIPQALQEEAFVAGTANAIEILPAEVQRKGFFDKIYRPPSPASGRGEEIFPIHVGKKDLDPATFKSDMLASKAKGFSGAEIEQAVDSVAFKALSMGGPTDQPDIMETISHSLPLFRDHGRTESRRSRAGPSSGPCGPARGWRNRLGGRKVEDRRRKASSSRLREKLPG